MSQEPEALLDGTQQLSSSGPSEGYAWHASDVTSLVFGSYLLSLLSHKGVLRAILPAQGTGEGFCSIIYKM